MNGIKSIRDLTVEGKRVWVRVDFNVPLDSHGNIADNTRIRAALPTINYLVEHGAKVVLASHLGRPKGKCDKRYTLKLVAKELATLCNQPVLFLDHCVGEDINQSIAEMANGSITLLENLRFMPQEEANDSEFSKQLAEQADIYVNDAFGTAHRAHASTAGIAAFVRQKAMGFLIEKELEFLTQKIDNPERPFCVVLGGAKISDKIGIVEALSKKADTVLLGGGMSFTFSAAQGQSIGNSLLDPDYIELAKNLLKNHKNIQLPVDSVATDRIDFKTGTLGALQVVDGSIPDGWFGVDIGPKTIALYSDVIRKSKMVLWNGPVGIFEISETAKGGYALAQALSECNGTTIVGGGDCIEAVRKSGYANSITFLSTGGGATLQLLEGKPLPGLEALKQ
ncbi:MAG TPA: phosphoglycerate kinase [Opitutae bacterium]|nr:phosphoglycerate kinase [Opitutae bacterium]